MARGRYRSPSKEKKEKDQQCGRERCKILSLHEKQQLVEY